MNSLMVDELIKILVANQSGGPKAFVAFDKDRPVDLFPRQML